MDRLEKLLWCIALPGLGQLLKGQIFKGVVLLFLEFLINVQSNLNTAIISSFQGKIGLAIEQTNYQWLMFYPCLYMFAMWDAYKCEISESPYSYIPFVTSAFLATVGLIYSSAWRVFGVLLGPVWLTMICCFIGLGIGWLIKFGLSRKQAGKKL